MKKEILPFLLTILLITSLSCEKKNTESPQLTLFSDTIDWNRELGEFYGGNSFYCWHNTDQGVVNLGEMPADCWKNPEDFNRIGLALWKAEPLCLPMAQGWSNSNACEDPEQAALEFFPLKARIAVVAVADGHNFSGWENHP